MCSKNGTIALIAITHDGSSRMVYMLTWLGYIDGKCYHIWHTYGSYGLQWCLLIITCWNLSRVAGLTNINHVSVNILQVHRHSPIATSRTCPNQNWCEANVKPQEIRWISDGFCAKPWRFEAQPIHELRENHEFNCFINHPTVDISWYIYHMCICIYKIHGRLTSLSS